MKKRKWEQAAAGTEPSGSEQPRETEALGAEPPRSGAAAGSAEPDAGRANRMGTPRKTETAEGAVWQDRLEQAWQALTERAPFAASLEDDPFYGQYRAQYQRQGQKAMQDAMGQAAALVGGYGSSYGQQLGQQAYYDRLSELDAILPSLYEQQREAYDRQTDVLLDQLRAAQDGYAAEQDREDALAEQAHDDAQISAQQARAQAVREQEAARELALMMLQAGLMPSAEMLAQAQISTQDAVNMQRYFAALLAAQR